jgi:transglutaminase-like putative cysteine protease
MPKMNVTVSLRYDVGTAGSLALRILPAATPQQHLSNESLVSSLGARSRIVTGRFGQRVLHVQAAPGPLDIDYSARVALAHHMADPSTLDEVSVADLPFEVLPFLHESALCATDALSQLAFRTFGRMKPGYARVATLCECVRERTRLDPAQTGVEKSVLDTLLDKSGASEHFAHLAIALCRALYIPARLVSVTWPGCPAVSGLHYCIEAFLGDRWYLFDPAGSSPAARRIRISTGRDTSDLPIVSIQGEAQQACGRLQIMALSGAGDMADMPHDRPAQAVSSATSDMNRDGHPTEQDGRRLA